MLFVLHIDVPLLLRLPALIEKWVYELPLTWELSFYNASTVQYRNSQSLYLNYYLIA